MISVCVSNPSVLTLCLHIAGWQRGETPATLASTHPGFTRMIIFDSQHDDACVRLCVLPRGKLGMSLCSGLNMHLCLPPADSVVVMTRRRVGGDARVGVCVHAEQELLFSHAS